MKQQFIKVKIYSDRGYVQGCIDASKVFGFNRIEEIAERYYQFVKNEMFEKCE